MSRICSVQGCIRKTAETPVDAERCMMHGPISLPQQRPPQDGGGPRTYPRKWTTVSHGTSRLRVPDGWLVSLGGSRETLHGIALSNAITFFPDASHEWILEEEE